MGSILRSITITELHGKPVNESEFKNSFLMVINALLGTWGSGDWGNGFWVKRGYTWSAKQTILVAGDIELPFRMVRDVVYVHDVSGSSVITNVIYVSDGKTLNMTQYIGKTVVLQVIDAKIVKE